MKDVLLPLVSLCVLSGIVEQLLRNRNSYSSVRLVLGMRVASLLIERISEVKRMIAG